MANHVTKLNVLVEKLRGSGVGAILARGSSGVLLVKVGNACAGFVLCFVLAKALGPEAFGDYIFVLAWPLLLVVFAKCGFDTAALRFVPGYRVNGQWALIRGFLRRGMQLVLAASIVSACVFAAAVWLLGDRMRPELLQAFFVACPLVVLLAVLQVRAAHLRAFKRVVASEAFPTVARPLMLAGAVGLIYLLGTGRMAASTALGVNLAITFLLVTVVTLVVRRTLPEEVHATAPEYRTAEWSRVALTLLLMSGFFAALSRTDVLMLGMFLDTTRAGVYAVASQVAQLVTFGLFAANAIAAPMVSELHSQNDQRRLQRVARLSALVALTVALPVFLGLIVLGPWVLSLFAPAFRAGYPSLIILCCGQLVNVLTASVGLLMVMTGHQKAAAKIMGAAALLNIALNATLIPLFGMIGAAAIIAVAMVGVAAINLLRVYIWGH